MSVWSHVCCSIRLDSLEVLVGNINVEEVIGPTYHPFSDNDEIYGYPNIRDYEEKEECKLPIGSEGSLYIKVIHNEDGNAMSSHNIVIWGDLRDYEDEEEIYNWFSKLLKDLLSIKGVVGIRQAVCNLDIETGLNYTYSYVDDHIEKFKIANT